MKTKTKIWLGIGAFVVIETAATGGGARPGPETLPWLSARPHRGGAATVAGGAIRVAQQADHAQDAGEGGEAGALARLPPELAFAVTLARSSPSRRRTG
jgi:hypothetical protein